MRLASMNGHQLGSFETTVILLEDGCERAGELSERITIAFVLDIPPVSTYIAEVRFEA